MGGNADILQHITFNGSTGASLAVQIAPGTRSNGPTQYEKNHGINCFNGHGAVDIDDKPITNLTVAGCIERCDADAECSAVVYRQDQQWCWRRAHVRIAECHAAARFDTYVKPV